MPIYEYECTACSKRTERLQKLSDPPLKECPECQGELQKIVSSAGLHFKGSGWYVTDYAKKNGKPEAKSEGDGKKATTESKKQKDKPATPAKGKKD